MERKEKANKFMHDLWEKDRSSCRSIHPYLQAYVEGFNVQYYDYDRGCWKNLDDEDAVWDGLNSHNVRVTNDTAYAPYARAGAISGTYGHCTTTDYVRERDSNRCYRVVERTDDGLLLHVGGGELRFFDYRTVFERFLFLDGTPVGKWTRKCPH